MMMMMMMMMMIKHVHILYNSRYTQQQQQKTDGLANIKCNMKNMGLYILSFPICIYAVYISYGIVIIT